jgi:hypothetical protein
MQSARGVSTLKFWPGGNKAYYESDATLTTQTTGIQDASPEIRAKCD